MGVYDILIDKDMSTQVKLFDCSLKVYKVGDDVPKGFGKNFTIVLPKIGIRFALIKDGKFFKLTNDRNETYSPYFSKWGEEINSIEDFRDPYVEMTKAFVKKEKGKGINNETT